MLTKLFTLGAFGPTAPVKSAGFLVPKLWCCLFVAKIETKINEFIFSYDDVDARLYNNRKQNIRGMQGHVTG